MARAISLLLMALALATTLCSLCAADPSEGAFFTSLYSDHRAGQVGDLVLVVISESSLASHSATRANDSSASGSIGAGVGWLDFIPLTSYTGQSKSGAKGQAQHRDLLSAQIATLVTGIAPSGNLMIEGERTIQVNHDMHTIRLSGEMRPEDLGPANTVLSHNVANARIEYMGADPARPGKRVGIITRILNWLF